MKIIGLLAEFLFYTNPHVMLRFCSLQSLYRRGNIFWTTILAAKNQLAVVLIQSVIA